jgi:hypothetical protein
MSRLVTIKSSVTDWEQNVITHLPSAEGQSDYATLCGLALDGDEDSGTEVPTPCGGRVTCTTCYKMWLHCRTFNAKSF